MRILFVSSDGDDVRVGAVQAQIRLAEVLRERGHECDLLFERDLAIAGMPERRWMLVGPWRARQAAMRQWRDHGPYDVIDVQGADGFVLGLLRRWSCYQRARLVVRSHGMEVLSYRGWRQDRRLGLIRQPWRRRLGYPLYRLTQEVAAYGLAHAAIVPNQREARLLRRWGLKHKRNIYEVPHGVRLFRCDQAPAADATRGRGVLFSGSWSHDKGFPYLAQAHAQLLLRGLTLPLSLLSATESESQPAALEEARIRAAFARESQPALAVMRRVADREAVFALYRAFDFLVLPSTTESFGLVVLEAMSQRLPVICTTACGVADYLRDGVEALVVPPRDPQALAAAMARLWQDPELRRRLAEGGHQAARRLSWMRATESTLAAYIGSPPTPPPVAEPAQAPVLP